MGCCTIRGLSFFAGLFAALCALPLRAQSPPCSEKKFPYPTLAQELHSEKVGESVPNVGKPVSSVVVSDLRIEGDVHNRKFVRNRILGKLKKREFVSEPGWVDAISEVDIRGDFQDRGYFEVEVGDVEVKQIEVKDQKQRFLLIAHVKEGQQFLMGDLTIQSADPGGTLTISREKLYDQIPLRTGDVLNADKLRLGVERLTKLYGSLGYIDFTAEPDFDIDHLNHRISVILKLSVQRQYRVESIEVFGLDPTMEEALRAKIRVHEIFDYKAIDDFFMENKKSLPHNAEPANSMHVSRNIAKATVNLRFDFIDCPLPID